MFRPPPLTEDLDPPLVFTHKQYASVELGSNISIMRRSVSSPDETPKRELKYDVQQSIFDYFEVFHLVMRHCVEYSILQPANGRRFSLLIAAEVAEDGLQGGMSANQRQKFHTDDVNQCLHN